MVMVGIAQLAEHLVVVQDVAGSSPVTHPLYEGPVRASGRAFVMSGMSRTSRYAGGTRPGPAEADYRPPRRTSFKS
jgi:hypothetical protein